MTKAQTMFALKSLPCIAATCLDGEYRVTISTSAFFIRHPELSKAQVAKRQEAIAYYCNDAEDALLTASVISAHFGLHGGLRRSR